MTNEEFRSHAHQMVDWMADYLNDIDIYPVKSQVRPKEALEQLPEKMPDTGESIEDIFGDFKRIVMPGITHWQHPQFYAYFQANNSPPSILAEMLTATLGIQGMKWETSPASTELEERVMDWLIDAINLPKGWKGVIQDSASSATLCAILTAREVKTQYAINQSGLYQSDVFRIYCSEETHSSIEKGAKIAGLGKDHVIKISTNEDQSMDTEVLREYIERDIAQGFTPLCIVAALGTTGTLAMDDIEAITKIATEHKVWLHIDAAYAGSALILDEYRHLIKGIERADSFVFNPHKWLFTNFDCSAYFVKDHKALVNTFAILPEYLKTQSDGKVDNHSDWGIPLGRRFRSLKLWFVLRYYGKEGLQNIIKDHIALAEWLEEQIVDHPDFQMITQRSMNLVCFRYCPKDVDDQEQLNEMNAKIVNSLNKSGTIYLTHTKVKGAYTMRMSIGQLRSSKNHVQAAWSVIQSTAKSIKR